MNAHPAAVPIVTLLTAAVLKAVIISLVKVVPIVQLIAALVRRLTLAAIPMPGQLIIIMVAVSLAIAAACPLSIMILAPAIF